MRLASYVSRVKGNPPERWVSAREALHAATEGGAKALGFDKLGRIEKGWKADLVLLDLSALHYIPLNDLASQIVFAEDGTGVESVMVGGRWVMRDRKLLTVDVEALQAQGGRSGRAPERGERRGKGAGREAAPLRRPLLRRVDLASGPKTTLLPVAITRE